MNGQQLEIAPTLPQGMFLPDLMSADQAIGMVQNVEIPADNSGTSFGPNSNRVIEFLVTNTGAFMDTINSYIRFNVSAVVNTTATTQSFRAYLSEGGVHSLFQTIEILSANSNTSIERIDRYNRYYSQVSTLTQPRQYVESVGVREADSADFIPSQYPLSVAMPGTVTIVNGTATGVSTLFTKFLGVGMEIIAVSTAGVSSRLVVISVASDTSCVLAQLGNAATSADVDLAALTLLFLSAGQNGIGRASNAGAGYSSPDGAARWQVGSNSNKTVATIATSLNNGAIQVCFQPLLGFLEMPELKLLPFFAGGGIRIRLTLADAWECFAFDETPGPAANANYAIMNPFLVARLVYPTDSLMDEFYGRYKSTTPLLNYAFQSVVHSFFQESGSGGAAGTQNMNIQSGLRSGKGFMMRIQDARGATNITNQTDPGKTSWCTDSIAQGRKAGLDTFQVSAGGQFYFPLSRPLSVKDDTANLELLAHAQALFGGLGNVYNQIRCKPAEWQSIFSLDHLRERGSSVGNSEPQRLVIACPIRRDPSLMSGIDLSVNPLLVNLNFDTAITLTNYTTGVGEGTTSRYFFIFILHDRIVSLNAGNGTVVRY